MIRVEALTRIKDLTAASPEDALLIVGGPGTGKSTILADAAALVDADVFRVRVNPAESNLELSGLSTIVASFSEPDAIDLSNRLLRLREGQIQVQEVTADLLAFIHGFAASPTLLLVDDVDLMDITSQVVLAMVAARLSGSGLRLVGTASSDPLPNPLLSLPSMTLAPLEYSEALALVSSLVGSIDAAVARVVVASSAGNPRALAHLTNLLTERQRVHAEALILPLRGPHVPDAPESSASTPAAAEARLLLERLSSSFLSSEEAVLQGSVRVPMALEELVASGTVVRDGRYLRIDNPLLRSQLYWSQSATTRLDHHASAMRAEDGHEPELALWHRSWLTPGAVAPEELLTAAAALTSNGRAVQALELAERALTRATGSTAMARALADLSTEMLHQGELDFAERYARHGQRLAGRSTVAPRLAVLRTRIEFLSSRRLLTTETDRWTSAHTSNDIETAAKVQLDVAYLHAERWETEAASALLERAGRLLANAPAGTVEMHSLVTMLLASLEGDPGPANRMYERVSRGAGRVSPQTLATLGRSLTYTDRFAESRRVLTALLSLEPAPDPIWLADASYFLAENDIMSGNHHEAMAAIDRINSSDSTDQLHRNLHRLLMAWYWQENGSQAEAEAAIDECTRRFAASDNLALTARLLAQQGSFALLDGRLDDAIAFFRTASTIGVSFKNPALLRHEVDLIEAYTLAGQLGEAVAQFQEFHARSAPYRSRWITLATARARALVTPGEPSLAAFQDALKVWHTGDSQFELGRTLMSFATRLGSLGHVPESKEYFLSARTIFTQLGAIPWARKADAARRGGESTPDHPLLQSLAPDEQRVALLVCRGMRNKEIAAELFVSLRTVEVRLTRIYHKLGARSRSHLTAMLTTDGGDRPLSNQST